MNLITGYPKDEGLRRSFNELSKHVFDLDFEPWYSRGFTDDTYIPYSLEEDGRIVANVSVNLMQLQIDGRPVQAAQLGTVMVDPEYRGRGLAAELMRTVLPVCRERGEFTYLFANTSVLDFYPKFGFERVVEHMAITAQPVRGERDVAFRPLDLGRPEDFSLFLRLIEHTSPVSRRLSHRSNRSLLLFYSLLGLKDQLYYLPSLDAAVAMEENEEELFLMDVFRPAEGSLDDIVTAIAGVKAKRIRFGFTPDRLESIPLLYTEHEEALFMQPAALDLSRAMFPVLSHT